MSTVSQAENPGGRADCVSTPRQRGSSDRVASRPQLTPRDRGEDNTGMAVSRISKEDLKLRLDGDEAGRPALADVRRKYAWDHSTLKLPGAVAPGPEGPVDGRPVEGPRPRGLRLRPGRDYRRRGRRRPGGRRVPRSGAQGRAARMGGGEPAGGDQGRGPRAAASGPAARAAPARRPRQPASLRNPDA